MLRAPHGARPTAVARQEAFTAERHAGGEGDHDNLGIARGTQLHILSFEGPDPYARIGGLETRVSSLCQALVTAGHDTHLWFVGDPGAPGHEMREGLHLHRWCQWLSRHHPIGVYDGEHQKVAEYAASMPPVLVRDHLLAQVARGGQAVVIAEEWQTVDAVYHLDHLLRQAGVRERVRIFWNANNAFGFENIDWPRLSRIATVTTVSRYMRCILEQHGVQAVVIPNGLPPDAYLPANRAVVSQLRKAFEGRLALTKMARWDPDKSWLGTVQIVAELKRRGQRPLLVARGGREAYGAEVLSAMRAAGLRVLDRRNDRGDLRGMVQALTVGSDVDVLHLTTHVDPEARRALFRASNVVMANSAKEPFGLVGLEAMAVGAIACTGFTGEDYALPGRNALVLQTASPTELMEQYAQLHADPSRETAMRRAGRLTAQQYAWPDVIRTSLSPRLGLC